MTSRGTRLLKAIEHYNRTKPTHFDTSLVLSKIKMISASDGQLKGVFTVDSSMCNSGDTLHGGFICAVFDTFATFAQLSHKNGRLSWTTGLQAQFLKPAKKGERILVETSPLLNGQYNLMETVLRNESTDALLAKGTVSLVAGSEKFQEMAKELLQFDVYKE